MRSEAVLQRLALKTKSLKTFAANVTVTDVYVDEATGNIRVPTQSKGVVRLARRNLACYEVSGTASDLLDEHFTVIYRATTFGETQLRRVLKRMGITRN